MKEVSIIKNVALVFAAILALVSGGFAQTVKREINTLVRNSSHVVWYEKLGNRLHITMEMIADFQEDRTSMDGRERDFTSIRIDANNNRSLDRDLDIAFGEGAGIICPQYLRDEWASSGCGVLRSEATIKASFHESPFQENPHPIFEYSLPLDELRRHSDTVGLIFKFHSASDRYVFYPAGALLKNSFEKTITLNLGKL